ncbi:nucleoside deaminase [Sorangium sp. So ce406]|uniref:nucleoside deaminase n=1 Tax=Sorangium sp. So ce406 TaxID=3133311 RepID=UPI003F5BAF62
MTIPERHLPVLRRCIELSWEARRRGDGPFGAVLVHDGRVILEATNVSRTQSDPLGHAEMTLLRAAVGQVPREVLSQVILYASTEPCVMCSGALYLAGIRHVVYAASAEAIARFLHDDIALSCREVLRSAREPATIEGPFLEEKALEPHRGFWPAGE